VYDEVAEVAAWQQQKSEVRAFFRFCVGRKFRCGFITVVWGGAVQLPGFHFNSSLGLSLLGETLV
jgi:hypothetical protein